MFLFGVFFLLALMCSQPRAFAEDTIRIERSLSYSKIKDTRLLADVYLPPTDGPHPTLLMIHGGAWFSGNKAHVSYHASYAAEQGYAVVAINYRLAPRHKFPAQVEDCRTALTWIKENADKYQFDKDRIGVYGYSAGAHLASLVGLSQNNREEDGEAESAPKSDSEDEVLNIKAIVAGGTPCEFSWISEDSKALAYWLGDSRVAVPETYAAASPIEFVDKDDPPIFLFHGTVDRVVPPQSPEKLKQKLDNAKVANELHVVESARHTGAFLDKTARQQAIRFLDRHLGSTSEQTSN